jgi:hypothetical protein
MRLLPENCFQQFLAMQKKAVETAGTAIRRATPG